MRVSDNSPKQPQPKNPRLYSGVISALNLIKFLGFIGSVGLGILVGQIGEDVGDILGFTTIIISGFTIYVSVQSCIAIIDLLSRIEHNTRRLRQSNYTETDF